VKKIEWMVAAGTVAALAGGLYSAGCVNTAGDCALIGTCGEGGGTGSASDTTTSATSSTGTGTSAASKVCESGRFGDGEAQTGRSIHVGMGGDFLLAGAFKGSLSISDKSATSAGAEDNLFVASFTSTSEVTWLDSFPVPYGAAAYDAAGGVVLAGRYTAGAVFGCATAIDIASDLYVVKLDNAGKCVWNKGFNAPMADVSLAVAANGHIALAGDAVGPMDFHGPKPGPLNITNGMPGEHDLFVVELDPEGSVLSAIGYGNKGEELINAVAFDAMGGTIITGTFTSSTLDLATGGNALKNSGSAKQVFVMRKGLGPDWSFTSPGAVVQNGTAVVVDGVKAIVAGDFTGSIGTLKSTDGAFFVMGIDIATGDVTWEKAFDGTKSKTIHALATDGAGAIALVGNITGDVDFGLGKLASPAGLVVARLNAADGAASSAQVFSSSDKSESVGYGVAFAGADLLVTGGFSGTLVLSAEENNMISLESAGETDVFLVKLCP
jgi:hypothetical protein